MIYRGYAERDLVTNRSSLLLYGSSEAERRAWAEEAAANFEAEGPLRTVSTPFEFQQALQHPRGVVYVADVAQLGDAGQLLLVRALREREERPKVVVGLSGTPDAQRDAGKLRTELHYALQMAHVNLDEPGLKEQIRARRARQPKRPAAPQPAGANSSATSARSKELSRNRSAAPSRSPPRALSAKPAARPQTRKPAAAKAKGRKSAAKAQKPAAKKASAKKPAARRRR